MYTSGMLLLMKAAESGEASSDLLSEVEVGTTAPVQPGTDVGSAVNTPRPIEPESLLTLSPRMLIVGLGLLIFLLALYFGIIR
jgi:hypothetical protein